MPRLEIELTSRRSDGTWTWRAAGARQPKGTVAEELVPQGVSTGDVVRAETEVDVDGITVVGIAAPPQQAAPTDRIEVIGTRGDEPPVTTTLAAKSDRAPRGTRKGRDTRGRDDSRGREREGRGRDRTDRSAGKRPAGKRPAAEQRAAGPGGERRERPPRPEPPPVPQRPKATRLKPRRARRQALVASLPPEQQPIAETLVQGGMAAVRRAIKDQNADARRSARPEVPEEPIIDLAEGLVPRLRSAEWLDRAEAAVATLDTVSLDDLRAVVAAANDAAKDPSSRALADALRKGLAQRLERAVTEWIEDITVALDTGRVVRALRVSSRPPDPKRRLPDELHQRLQATAAEAMAPDVGPQRWALVLEAVSFSPVRKDVVPAGPPSSAPKELLELVAKAAQRAPQIATIFGIDVSAPPGTPGRMPSAPSPPPPVAAPPASTPPDAGSPSSPEPVSPEPVSPPEILPEESLPVDDPVPPPTGGGS